MSREIKFRIWDKKYKTYDYNTSPDVFISTEGEVFEKDERVYGMQSYLEYNRSDDYEISQYTGLKDKNGKEIYEGDIVAVSEEYGGHAYTPLVVDFKDCCFVLRRINYMADYSPMFNYDFTQIYEVIGNQFENPELLEQS